MSNIWDFFSFQVIVCMTELYSSEPAYTDNQKTNSCMDDHANPRYIPGFHVGVSVADLEIFRGGFSCTKTPAKFEVKTEVNTKNPTHALTILQGDFCSSRYHSSPGLAPGALFQRGFQLKPLQPPCIRHWVCDASTSPVGGEL